MIWINKHCFNGLYRVNSKGLFNVSYNGKTGIRSADNKNLLEVSEYLNKSGIMILQGDFEAACESVKSGDFVYLDPPYLSDDTGDFTQYAKDGFYLKDHERLRDLFLRLDSIGAYVMQSNRDVDLIYEMYKGYHIESFGVRRSISCNASTRKGREVLIMNY
jgi:DNA adenine methylase